MSSFSPLRHPLQALFYEGVSPRHFIELFSTDLLTTATVTALSALAVFLALFFLRNIAKSRIAAIATKLQLPGFAIVAELVGRTSSLLLLFISVFAAAELHDTAPSAIPLLRKAVIVALFLQFGLWGERLIRFFLEQQTRRAAPQDPSRLSAYEVIAFLARGLLWAVLLLLTLANFGVDVTALIASLGIGGVAIALAVQSILGDLLSSLSILLDKPFEVGDFITTGNTQGTVERIGIKSTRIRALSGEQIILSNSDLLASRVHNFKRMTERRILFTFGVIYQTPPDVVAAIPEIIRKIIEATPLARVNRVHFKSFGQSALEFEVVYFVESPDINTSMDVQHEINLEILRQFAAAGIIFAYPTQTVFLASPGVGAPPSFSSPETA